MRRAAGDQSLEDALRRRLLPLELEKVVRVLSDFPAFGQKKWSSKRCLESVPWARARGLRHLPIRIKRLWQCKNSPHVAGWWVEWLCVDEKVQQSTIRVQVRAGLLEEHCPKLVEDYHRRHADVEATSTGVKRKISQTDLDVCIGRQRTLSTSFSFCNKQVRKSLSTRRRSIDSTKVRKSMCANLHLRRTDDKSRLEQETQEERLQPASKITEFSNNIGLTPLRIQQGALTCAFPVVKKLRTSINTPYAEKTIASQRLGQRSDSSDLENPCRVFVSSEFSCVAAGAPSCSFDGGDLVSLPKWKTGILNADPKGLQVETSMQFPWDLKPSPREKLIVPPQKLIENSKPVLKRWKSETSRPPQKLIENPTSVLKRWKSETSSTNSFSQLLLSPPEIGSVHELLCSNSAIFNYRTLKPEDVAGSVSQCSDENKRCESGNMHMQIPKCNAECLTLRKAEDSCSPQVHQDKQGDSLVDLTAEDDEL
jgi:hypothetical protein